MSPAKKFAVSAAALVLLAASLWIWDRSRSVEPRPARAALQAAPAPAIEAHAPEALEAASRNEVEAAIPVAPTPEVAADPRYGSLLLRVVWGDDQTPATGVWMRLYQRGADDPYRDTLDALTDERGEVRVERVCAGRVAVKFDRGSQAEIEVEGGRENVATLEIPAGFDVRGTVLDFDGRPFAGAEIYVQVFGGSYEGFVVARSAGDGSFAIRALKPRPFVSISARAAGRTPTKQHTRTAEVGETVVLQLAFEATGGALAGLVLTSAGAPIVGARVLVGTERDTNLVALADGTLGRPPAAQLVRTDERGEFAFDGLAPGVHALQARASGFAPWAGEIEIVAGLARAIDVRLLAGAALNGVVRDGQGATLAGVEVWASSGGAFASTMRRTLADGSYAMRDLPLGELEVTAEGGERGYAATTLFGVAGGELRWDPVLSTGARLRVQLLAPGLTLAGWRITAEEEPPALETYADTLETDAAGLVEFVNVPDVELRLSLRAPGPHAFPRGVLHGVRARDGEVVIEPDLALEPTVYLRGRVVDPDGKPLGGARVAPQNPALFHPPYTITDAATGRFELGPLPPGEWSLYAFAPGFAHFVSPSMQLVAGESWDFGDLRLARGGTLIVTVTGACGDAAAATIVRLGDRVQWTEQLTLQGSEPRSWHVSEGVRRLRIERVGCAPVEREVEVRVGEETRVTVELGAG